jgi:hypothetical protein
MCHQDYDHLEESRGEPISIASISFWWQLEVLVVLGLQTHPSNLCLCFHMAFFPSVFSLRTLVIGFKAHWILDVPLI